MVQCTCIASLYVRTIHTCAVKSFSNHLIACCHSDRCVWCNAGIIQSAIRRSSVVLVVGEECEYISITCTAYNAYCTYVDNTRVCKTSILYCAYCMWTICVYVQLHVLCIHIMILEWDTIHSCLRISNYFSPHNFPIPI